MLQSQHIFILNLFIIFIFIVSYYFSTYVLRFLSIFKVAFPLMKPYLDLKVASTSDPSSDDNLEGDEYGEAPDLVQDPSSSGTPGQPEVYDPWRQNQQVLSSRMSKIK